MTKPTKKYPYAELVLDPRCQARAEVNADAVEDYRVAYEAKVVLPPLDVVLVEGAPYVVDGWHRMAGAAKAGVAWMPTTVVGTGTIDDAIHAALAANRANGLRRTNADKRRAVQLALDSARLGDASTRVIADHLGLSPDFVSRMRAEWEAVRKPLLPEPTATQATGQVSSEDTSRRTGRDGKSYPARAPKSRIVLDEPAPDEDQVSSKDTSRDDDEPPQVSSEDTSKPASAMPTHGPELERVADAIASLRIALRGTSLPTSHAQAVESGLKNVESSLRYAVPETCPRCEGARCMQCRQRGWVERSEGERMRATVRRLAR